MKHNRSPLLFVPLVGCLGAFGCASDDGATTPQDAAASPATDTAAVVPDANLNLSEADATSEPDGATSEAGPLSEAGTALADLGVSATPVRGIVAAHSDYQASAISLLDRDGNVIKDGCITSGTGGPGLTKTLSGDVALPTQIAAGSAITLVDRGNAALVWIDPATCAPLHQLAVGTGFKANPHDYVELSATKAYVPRYERNGAPTATAGDFDEGNDLLIVDPSQPKIVGRIDLVPFTPAGVLPRADRALLADGRVFVSLNASNAKFGANAMGRLVMVDPATDQVTGAVDLPGTKNCGALSYLAAEKKLFVACTGDYGDAKQADASAIVTLSLATNPPSVVARVGASAANGLIFSNSSVAALDGQSAFGVTMGDFSNTPPDSLWLLPQDATTPTKLFDSAEAFAIWSVLVDGERGRVFVTDGTTVASPSVRVFERVGGAFRASAPLKTNPTHKLPAHGLAWF